MEKDNDFLKKKRKLNRDKIKKEAEANLKRKGVGGRVIENGDN